MKCFKFFSFQLLFYKRAIKIMVLDGYSLERLSYWKVLKIIYFIHCYCHGERLLSERCSDMRSESLRFKKKSSSTYFLANSLSCVSSCTFPLFSAYSCTLFFQRYFLFLFLLFFWISSFIFFFKFYKIFIKIFQFLLHELLTEWLLSVRNLFRILRIT